MDTWEYNPETNEWVLYDNESDVIRDAFETARNNIDEYGAIGYEQIVRASDRRHHSHGNKFTEMPYSYQDAGDTNVYLGQSGAGFVIGSYDDGTNPDSRWKNVIDSMPNGAVRIDVGEIDYGVATSSFPFNLGGFVMFIILVIIFIIASI